MLRHVVYEGLRKQRVRPVTLFYAARSKADRPFEKEIAELKRKFETDKKRWVALKSGKGDALEADVKPAAAKPY